MSDQTEFSRLVPAIFQEKAVDWLFDITREDIEAMNSCPESFYISREEYKAVTSYRASLLRGMLISLYQDEVK
ncbi:Uncharacterised protein [Cedecea lapagei]|uniref:Uncharacterized protein n=1 Tax=Cedecea lapagei TaxID=158823 RepID=A0A3S4MHF5_9ENTR|nr:hypothetical protein [Cedecea lapagei]VEB99972.1 Uncharacterised protein [Cedecea lapagei]